MRTTSLFGLRICARSMSPRATAASAAPIWRQPKIRDLASMFQQSIAIAIQLSGSRCSTSCSAESAWSQLVTVGVKLQVMAWFNNSSAVMLCNGFSANLSARRLGRRMRTAPAMRVTQRSWMTNGSPPLSSKRSDHSVRSLARSVSLALIRQRSPAPRMAPATI
jgi:hypothetical protein